MKRNICLVFFLIALTADLFATSKVQMPLVREGTVSCEGKGIAGVAVTDGFSVCVTNKNGKYRLQANPETRFVYISSPAGYTVPVKNSVPQFFQSVPELENKAKIDFYLTKLPNDDTRHGFVVWADPQVKNNHEAMQAKEVANDLSTLLTQYGDIPFHGLGCGDIVGDNPALFDSIKKLLSPIGIPFYQSMGNHDMHYNGRSNYLASDMYERHFGPAYYSFNRGEIHYVVLNDVFYIGRDYFYIGYLPEEQLAWLEKDLSLVPKGSTVVVALHIPTALGERDLKQFSYSNISRSVANKQALYKILQPFNTHIVSGHMHVSNNLFVSPQLFEHNVSSVCGAWWQGDYAEDGTPKGYAVFEADGSELKWYFKSSGYNRDYQFRAYPIGDNPEQLDYLTVNVWNWDPEWKVYWYEDGQRMGEMEAYSGLDPETTKAYSNKEKLAYKWISSRETSHLFRARPKSVTAKITVKVIDRFGTVYKQDVQ